MDTFDDIAKAFDARAGGYNRNEWHRHCAERLVVFSRLRPGHTVLDCGTGTGFAAVAAARAVGVQGRIVAIDLSPGMLAIAAQNVAGPHSAPIEWRQGNAAELQDQSAASFDAVLCAAALHYMPVGDALAAWHRVLKPGGTVAFSCLRSGSALAVHVFRECAAEAGVELADPVAALGSEARCHDALRKAGFVATSVTSTLVSFSAQDRAAAWESNLASPKHARVKALGADTLDRMRAQFERRLAEEEQQRPGAATTAEVLLAKGVR